MLYLEHLPIWVDSEYGEDSIPLLINWSYVDRKQQRQAISAGCSDKASMAKTMEMTTDDSSQTQSTSGVRRRSNCRFVTFQHQYRIVPHNLGVYML